MAFASLSTVQAADYYWNGQGTNIFSRPAWSTSPTSATPNPSANPGANDDIYFSIPSVTGTQTVALGGNNGQLRSINFLTGNPNTIIDEATNRTFYLGAGGLTMAAGSGSVTFGGTSDVNFLFSSHQEWLQNSSNALTISTNFLVGHTAGTGLRDMKLTFDGSGVINFDGNYTIGNGVNTVGALYQKGTTVNSNHQTLVGLGQGSHGFYGLSGGIMNVGGTGNVFRIGVGGVAATATGILHVNGGTLNIASSLSPSMQIVGSGGTDAAGVGGRGVVYVTSGGINASGDIVVGARSGHGQLTVADTGFIDTLGNITVVGNSHSAADTIGIANINQGGVVTANGVARGVSNGTGATLAVLNFDGGTLRTNSSNSAFISGMNAAYIYSKGAVIDSSTHNITVDQSLLAANGSGFSSISVTGSGYIAPPYVEINDPTGTGATAVANIDEDGNLTGITITSAGTGYTNPTVTIVGGGGTTSSSVAVQLEANTSGGLTKIGTGRLTLTGANTYTGDTVVEEGTLIVGVSGVGSLGATVVAVNEGATLGGSGFIDGAVNVDGTILSSRSTGSLTINDALTLTSTAVALFEIDGTTDFNTIDMAGDLTLDGTIRVTFDGYSAADGDVFALFSGWDGAIIDNGFTFDFSGALLSGGLVWDTSDFLTSGSISVALIPEPSALLLTGGAALLLLGGARFRRGRVNAR